MAVAALAPELAVVTAALAVVIADLLPRPEDTSSSLRRGLLPALSLLGLAVAAALSLRLWGQTGTAFQGTLLTDSFAVFFQLLILGSTALVVLGSIDYAERFPRFRGEAYALLLFVTSGLMLLVRAGDLITLFVALELTSIGQFVLAGFLRDSKAAEGSLKYLLLGAVSTSVFLYGMALTFGLTGTTDLAGIAEGLARPGTHQPALIAALVMMAAGFGFKVAAVPFQMWVPDVYEGAPIPIAGFLAVASKAGGFAVLLRVFHTAFGAAPIQSDWATLFASLSIASMVLGNVVAMQQSNIKRLMGYSSIAQAGYLLIGLATTTASGRDGVLFFLGAYAFTTLAAFLAITAISHRLDSDQIADYAGLWRRSPYLAIALALALFSLTGLPPTAGFWAKVYLFGAAIEGGLAWLAVIAVLNSVVSAYYYLRPVKAMFLEPPATEAPLKTNPTGAIALAVVALGTLVLGILPAPLLNAAIAAGATLVR